MSIPYEIFSIGNNEVKPLVIVNVFEKDGEKLFKILSDIGCRDCYLAVLEPSDWQIDLSPWKSKAVFPKGDDFGEGADNYIKEICENVVPEIDEKLNHNVSSYYIAGYSFAGLFALYSLYKTDMFEGAVCASGSLWFSGFKDYVTGHKMLSKPKKIYFSLGDRESKTKNPVMRTVDDRTRSIYTFYKDNGTECIYEMNSGNHFTETTLRLAKGIKWVLL